ncbi:serine protease [Lithospermum erythrorhizon]|uniref:Serine protease n=1 Tax=Lithospermum erythrorhizon TaxID=34254 RepID=A0AAV3R979_LITER
MALMEQTRTFLTTTGRFVNEVISFIIFSVLDILDFILCHTYRVLDFVFEAEWKPCYCSSPKEAITSSGKILVSEKGESKKIVCLSSSTLQLEEISDTLYTRPSLVSQVSKSTVRELKKLKVETTMIQSCEEIKKGMVRSSTFSVNSTIVEMLQGKVGKVQSHCIPRWSDCDCHTCHSWSSSCNDTLYVKAHGERDNVQEDVIFIHGFISSSGFWTETVFPNFSESAKSKYRFLAFDLLGFGRSPKPIDSLYTLGEHLNMIEGSVLEPHKVKSFHIVAHSLGCIIALALAVKYKGSIKSLTLLAPVSTLMQDFLFFP